MSDCKGATYCIQKASVVTTHLRRKTVTEKFILCYNKNEYKVTNRAVIYIILYSFHQLKYKTDPPLTSHFLSSLVTF